MLRNLKLDVFYPHPPEKVWQVLTNSQALAAWLMENDFEPRLGHKFKFRHSTLPGMDNSIECQVIELEEPKRLSYTWQDQMMCQPSVVTWLLNPVDGGTKLQLLHKVLQQVAIEKLPATVPRGSNSFTDSWQGKLSGDLTRVTQALTPNTSNTSLLSIPVGRFEVLESAILSSLINGGWSYKLKEKLTGVLVGFNIENE